MATGYAETAKGFSPEKEIGIIEGYEETELRFKKSQEKLIDSFTDFFKSLLHYIESMKDFEKAEKLSKSVDIIFDEETIEDDSESGKGTLKSLWPRGSEVSDV